MTTNLNSHFVNVQTTKKNAAGYSVCDTIGALHLAGSTKQNAQNQVVELKSHEGYLNLAKLNEKLSAGEVLANKGYIKIQFDENRNYTGQNKEIMDILSDDKKPAMDGNQEPSLHSHYVVVKLNSKNEQGYPKTAIVGSMVQKGTILPGGKAAYSNFVSLNNEQVKKLQAQGELPAQLKYLSFKLVANRNCSKNYSTQHQQPAFSSDDIPF